MKLFGEINTASDYSKTIQFKNEYFERVASYKQISGGSSFVVDFELKILPGSGDKISVYWIENDQTNTCIEYIFKGIEKFIALKKDSQISVKPFEIIISGAIVHPVDFKPHRYVLYTCKRINEILFEIAKKEIHKQHTTTFNKTDNHEALLNDRKLPVMLSQSHYRILLPNRKLKKLKLPSKHNYLKELTIERLDSSIGAITILIKENDFGHRHLNSIAFAFDQNRQSINAFFSIIDGVKKFVDDVMFDIGGYNIYILDSNLDFYEPGFNEIIYWFLKELMIAHNEIDKI